MYSILTSMMFLLVSDSCGSLYSVYFSKTCDIESVKRVAVSFLHLSQSNVVLVFHFLLLLSCCFRSFKFKVNL